MQHRPILLWFGAPPNCFQFLSSAFDSFTDVQETGDARKTDQTRISQISQRLRLKAHSRTGADPEVPVMFHRELRPGSGGRLSASKNIITTSTNGPEVRRCQPQYVTQQSAAGMNRGPTAVARLWGTSWNLTGYTQRTRSALPDELLPLLPLTLRDFCGGNGREPEEGCLLQIRAPPNDQLLEFQEFSFLFCDSKPNQSGFHSNCCHYFPRKPTQTRSITSAAQTKNTHLKSFQPLHLLFFGLQKVSKVA